MLESLIFIGMDVHQDTVTLAVFEGASKEAAVVQKLPNDLRKLRRFFDRWAKRGEIRTCHEASGAGYVLYHELTEWGHACEIIAPSLTPIRPWEQRKHAEKGRSAPKAAPRPRQGTRGRAREAGDPRGPRDDHTPLQRRAVRRGVGNSHAQEALTGQTREKAEP